MDNDKVCEGELLIKNSGEYFTRMNSEIDWGSKLSIKKRRDTMRNELTVVKDSMTLNLIEIALEW